MYMSIGFLVAGLIAISVIPLVHRRAERLTMRRIEASLPLTLGEIQANKDLLRANFAVSTPRLEIIIEQLKATAAGYLAELGRKQDAINLLTIQRDTLNLEVVALKSAPEIAAGSTKLTAPAAQVSAVPLNQEVSSPGRSVQTDTWARDQSDDRDQSDANEFSASEPSTHKDTWTRDEGEEEPSILPTIGQSDAWLRHRLMANTSATSTFIQSIEEDTWARDEHDPSEPVTKKKTHTRLSKAETGSSHVSAG